MEEIIEDIKKLETDAENIKCNPVVIFIKDSLKCFQDSISYFFNIKTKQ